MSDQRTPIRPFLALLLSLSAVPAAFATGCDLTEVKNVSKLSHILSQRSIEIIVRAGQDGWRNDADLTRLVAPTARSGLGTGDVGRPLGTGVEGVHSLATMMGAESYGYNAWNYIPYAVDGCAESKAEVAFFSADQRRKFTIKFTYINGQAVAVDGWEGTYVTGKLRDVTVVER